MPEETGEKAGSTRWPRPVSKPVVTVETAPFWDACAEGKFLIKRCTACGQAHYYPRAACPFCYSERVVWEAASGEGVIYSFTVVRRAPTGPYAPAYVQLKEGPRVFTNLVHADFDALRIGQNVKVVFQPAGEGAFVPMFAPT